VFSFEHYEKQQSYFKSFQGLETFNFSTYKSSQYAHMAEDLYERFFKSSTT